MLLYCWWSVLKFAPIAGIWNLNLQAVIINMIQTKKHLPLLIRIRHSSAWTWTPYQKRRKLVQSETFKSMFIFYKIYIFVFLEQLFINIEAETPSLRKKCLNLELFSSAFFLHSDWIRRDAGKNLMKYGRNADQNNSKYQCLLRSADKDEIICPARFSFNYFAGNLF